MLNEGINFKRGQNTLIVDGRLCSDVIEEILIEVLRTMFQSCLWTLMTRDSSLDARLLPLRCRPSVTVYSV